METLIQGIMDKEKGPQICMACNYDDDSLIEYRGYLLDLLNKHSKTVSIPAHQHAWILLCFFYSWNVFF